MGHGLELVVDEELGGHHDEAKCQEEPIDRAEDEAVPALVFIVDDGVDAVTESQGEEGHAQVFKCKPVKLLCPGVLIVFLVVQFQPGNESPDLVLKVKRHILDFGYFPYLNCQAYKAGDPDDCVGVVVKHVEENYEILEHIEEN